MSSPPLLSSYRNMCRKFSWCSPVLDSALCCHSLPVHQLRLFRTFCANEMMWMWSSSLRIPWRTSSCIAWCGKFHCLNIYHSFFAIPHCCLYLLFKIFKKTFYMTAQSYIKLHKQTYFPLEVWRIRVIKVDNPGHRQLFAKSALSENIFFLKTSSNSYD